MRMAATCMFFLALLAGVASGEENLSLEQVLARHNATLERLKRCVVTTRETWMLKRADSTTERVISTRECKVRMDGSLANLLVDEVNYPPGASPSLEADSQGNANEFNYVCNDQVLQIFYPHETFDVRPDAPRAVNGRLSPQPVDEYFVHHTMGHAAIAFGLTSFLSPIPIARLISISRNGPVTKDDLGYRIEGTAPDGTRHKVWFDPQASFIVRKLVFEQTGEVLNDNRFQHNRRVLSSRFGFSEKALVNSVTFEIRNVQVVPWKNMHVITGLETTKTVTATDGTKSVERTSHSLTDWNLDPDFSDPASFRPLLPVPDGSRVFVQDTPSLEYAYKGDHIELAVHKKTVESLEHVKLPSRPDAPRMQWIWAAVSAVLAVAWWRLRALAG